MNEPIALVSEFPEEPLPHDGDAAIIAFEKVLEALRHLQPKARQRVLGAAWVFFVAHVPPVGKEAAP